LVDGDLVGGVPLVGGLKVLIGGEEMVLIREHAIVESS
jgi:hypothetical protein